MSKSEIANLWRERLRRFDRAGTTVAAFCAAEGVFQPSYYQSTTKTSIQRYTSEANRIRFRKH